MSEHYIIYYDKEKSKLRYEDWKNEDGWFHREDGPARITYYPNGQIKYADWYLDGVWHNLEGPAFICYNSNITIDVSSYYIDGNYLTYEQWLLHPKRIEHMVKKELKV